MPNFFPCPNPACTYQFDADQLPAAAMVTCPICRTRFPYRAAAPTTAAAPAANEETSALPDDNPFGSPGAPVERSTRPNRLVNVRNVPKTSKSNTALMALGAAVVVAVLLVCIILALRGNPFKSEKKPEEIHTYEEGNFKFRNHDPEVWKKDTMLTNALKVNGFALRRSNPEAWFVVHYRDFKGRDPRADEMRVELSNMLRAAMKNVQKEPMEKVTIGDRPADGINFTGTWTDKDVYGEAFSFAHQGIGYVLLFFSTSTEWEAAKKELNEFRDSFAFVDRKNWRETERDSIALYEKDMPYQLSDTDQVWMKARIIADGEPTKGREFAMTREMLKAHDEKATMYLKMSAPVRDAKQKRDAPEALAMVLELDKAGGDPLEAARKHLLGALEKDEAAGAKVTLDPAGKTISGVAVPANVGIYRTTTSVSREAKKFYAVSAMPLGDKLIVALAWCREKDADIFEPYLINLAASLRERR